MPRPWRRDIVPRSGKLIHLYKRPGQRVLINSRGVSFSSSHKSLSLQCTDASGIVRGEGASLLAHGFTYGAHIHTMRMCHAQASVLLTYTPGLTARMWAVQDMLVRPAFVEMTAQTMPFRSSVNHHFLANYQASFLAICSAQFGEKAFSDGVEVSNGACVGCIFACLQE